MRLALKFGTFGHIYVQLSHNDSAVRGMMNSKGKSVSESSPVVRFLGFIRPHMRLVVGAALMGVGKFTLPLAFPLAFKYVVDVLLTAHAQVDGINRVIDGWCAALASIARLGVNAPGKARDVESRSNSALRAPISGELLPQLLGRIGR